MRKEEMAEIFYKRLVEFRVQKGVSARAMNMAMDQSSGYMNNIENRKSFPSMEMFFAICEYFKIEPKDFFDVKVELADEFRELVFRLSDFTPEQLKLVKMFTDEIEKNS